MTALADAFATRASAARRRRTTSVWRREPSPIAVVAIGIGASLFFIAVWAWLTREGGPVSSLLMPSPQAFLDALWRLLRRPYLGNPFYVHILSSLGVVLGGWLLAAIVGLPLGIAMAWWRRLRWTENAKIRGCTARRASTIRLRSMTRSRLPTIARHSTHWPSS